MEGGPGGGGWGGGGDPPTKKEKTKKNKGPQKLGGEDNEPGNPPKKSPPPKPQTEDNTKQIGHSDAYKSAPRPPRKKQKLKRKSLRQRGARWAGQRPHKGPGRSNAKPGPNNEEGTEADRIIRPGGAKQRIGERTGDEHDQGLEKKQPGRIARGAGRKRDMEKNEAMAWNPTTQRRSKRSFFSTSLSVWLGHCFPGRGLNRLRFLLLLFPSCCSPWLFLFEPWSCLSPPPPPSLFFFLFSLLLCHFRLG